MKSLTLALVSMEPEDVTEFRRLFGKLRSQLTANWKLVDAADADLNIVDVDSIYGHMDWLQLTGNGQRTAILTAAEYADESDLVFYKPLQADNLLGVLGAAAVELGGMPLSTADNEPPSAAADDPGPRRGTRPPATDQPAQQSDPGPDADEVIAADELGPALPGLEEVSVDPSSDDKPELLSPSDIEFYADPETPAPAESGVGSDSGPVMKSHSRPQPEPQADLKPPRPHPAPKPESDHDTAPSLVADTTEAEDEPAIEQPETVADWLLAGQFDGPARVAMGDEAWVIDPAADVYYGPAKLKPFTQALAQPVAALADVDAAALESARGGDSMPLARLRWYAGLLASPGHLGGDLDPASSYKLTRWPKIEREFPRHFRIATAMLKQAGSIAELAAASGAPEGDVADFINAGWVIGIVEQPGSETSDEPQRRGRVMSRLRNLRR